VDITAELFAMTACCTRAGGSSVALADYFCREARLRVAQLFRDVHQNEDRRGYRLAQQLLKEVPASLASGFVHRPAMPPAT